MANKINTVLEDLVKEAEVIAERLETVTEKFSAAIPDPDESSTLYCIDILTESEDVADYPEEFGNLVGGELFVHGAAFMSQAGIWLEDMIGVDSDCPKADQKYAKRFRSLLIKFVSDYSQLRSEWKRAQRDEK